MTLATVPLAGEAPASAAVTMVMVVIRVVVPWASMKATVTTMVLAGAHLAVRLHREDGPGLPMGAVPLHPDAQPEQLQLLADLVQRFPDQRGLHDLHRGGCGWRARAPLMGPASPARWAQRAAGSSGRPGRP